MSREITIYADESVSSGLKFGNFYGGAAVESAHLDYVNASLLDAKDRAGLGAEAKWSKVSATYLPRYVDFADTIFDLVQDGYLKMRVMFTENRLEPLGLEPYHYENEYQILYYYFLKHAFGLAYANENQGEPLSVRFFLDELPVNPVKRSQFKGFIRALEHDRAFVRAGITIPERTIAEIDSREHVLLQAVDVILGAMQFKLNKRHLAIPVGQRTRGAKTRAKERLYKHINERLQGIRPGFNVGITTGVDGDRTNRWRQRYRHWKFVSSNRRIR